MASSISNTWLPLEQAREYFGYTHTGSLRNRLRQLRERGYVVDIGRPPAKYPQADGFKKGKIVVMWLNPRMALLRSDAPRKLLNPKPGKRSR